MEDAEKSPSKRKRGRPNGRPKKTPIKILCDKDLNLSGNFIQMPLSRDSDDKNDDSNVKASSNTKKRSTCYSNKFSKKFLINPQFKDWISASHDVHKAYCRYCVCCLRAHKYDLVKHMESKKHQNAVEEGNAVDYVDSDFCPSTNVVGEDYVMSEDIGVRVVDVTPADATIHHMDFSSAVHYVEDIDHVNTDERLVSLADRVKRFVSRDLEKTLFNNNGDLLLNWDDPDAPLDERVVKKMSRICVAHLSQQYSWESALEAGAPDASVRVSSVPSLVEMSNDIANLKIQLEQTVSELNAMKS